jgi:pterin-4a-carbinolamine dehydratase
MQVISPRSTSAFSRWGRNRQPFKFSQGHHLFTRASLAIRGHVSSMHPNMACSPLLRNQSRAMASSASTKSPNLKPQELELELQGEKGPVKRKVVLRPTPKALQNGLEKHLMDLPIHDTSLIIDGWFLDEHGDAIHRHLLYESHELAHVEARISTAADSLKHHPHVSKQQMKTLMSNTLWLVTVTCTTHQPRGLSVRDIKLAKAITKDLVLELGPQHTWRPPSDFENRGIMRAHLEKHRSEIECAVCK